MSALAHDAQRTSAGDGAAAAAACDAHHRAAGEAADRSGAQPNVPATLVALLRARAAGLGEARAYTFLAAGEIEAATLTFAGLARAACGLAQALRARIEHPGNVLLAYPPGLEFVVAFFACIEAGLAAVPVCPPHPRRGNERLAAIAADCGARALLTTSALAAWCGSAGELAGLDIVATDRLAEEGESAGRWQRSTEAAPGTIAFLQYTSGSTSNPRGVCVTHANVLANLAAIHAAEGNDAASRGVSWLPAYHDMGLIEGILQPLFGGFPTWLMPPGAFLQRPSRWLHAISRHRASVSGGPDFAFDACVRRIADEELAALDLRRWRVAYCGAEPVRAETLARFAMRFERCGFRAQALRPVYGLAEATLLVAASDPHAARPVVRHAARADLEAGRFVAAREGMALVSCGRPQPGTAIAIVDPAGAAALPEGEIGEIWVSGPAVAAGYWPAGHDADVFGCVLAGRGPARWLRTGDLGFVLDAELYVTGRRKDLIILRGRKLHPQDIEHTVHSAAAQSFEGVAAFALERSEGEAVVVLAELRQARLAGEPAACLALADSIRGEVYRRHDIAIDALGFVRAGSLARTSSGKLMRFRCRQDFVASRLPMIARFDMEGVLE